VGRSIDRSRSEGSLGCSFSRQRQDETRTTGSAWCSSPSCALRLIIINLITSSLMETTNTDKRRQGSQRGKRQHNQVQKSEIHPKSEVNIYTRITTNTIGCERARLSSFRTTILIRHSQRAYLIRPSVVTHPPSLSSCRHHTHGPARRTTPATSWSRPKDPRAFAITSG
jgi:hypothetical protein